MHEDYTYVIDGNIVVRGIKMPRNVRGFIVCERDGSFNIYVNSALEECAQKAAVKHELNHAYRHDFYSQKYLFEIEEGDSDERIDTSVTLTEDYSKKEVTV